MCHIGTWSTRYYMRTVEKVWMSKVKKNMVCRVSKNDTRQKINGVCRPLTEAALCQVSYPDTRQRGDVPNVIF